MYFVVYLKCKRYIALSGDWIENPVVGKPSKVFFSPERSTMADFTLETTHYLRPNSNACYDGFVYRGNFGKSQLVSN